METLKELVAKYTEEENIPALDELYNRLSQTGTQEEREILADAYISHFGQCHYDYMCGKFDKLDWIWELLEILEKIKHLLPLFDQYYFYKAHVYEMLSSTYETLNDKIKYLKICIEYLRKQREINSEDVTLLTDLAQNIFQYSQLSKSYTPQIMSEIKSLFIEAIHLERKGENQHSFFGFNGTAIDAFLNCSYSIIALSFEKNEFYHQEFLSAFKQTIDLYTEQDPVIYYHWVDTLFRITDWVNYPAIETCRISQKVVDNIWIEIQRLLVFATDLSSDNEHFLTSMGHLFDKVARKENNLSYYQVAFNYYLKALKVNDSTWSNPYYTANALKMMAFIQLQQGNQPAAVQLFNQGLNIFEQAQKKVNDFQLSVYHGDYLFDYAKFIESFSNEATLLAAIKQFEDSRILGKDFYTHPYYGLAKTLLRLGDKQKAKEVLESCGKIFSNEFHTHDFNEIINNEDFKELKNEFPKIIANIGNLIG